MKLSLSWIQDHVDYHLDRPAEELADLISLRVAEVEGVERLGEALQQVRVVEILATEPHPDADKLRIATVTDGEGETQRIVCGATNCRPGIRVPFADLGAVLPTVDKDGNVSTFTIKRAKIRGVESTGMLCAADELGVPGGHDGLLELPLDAPVGTCLAEIEPFKSAADLLFEIDNKSLTHRPDLWGHYGFAREFSVMFDLPLAPYPQGAVSTGPSSFSIVNEVPDRCFRYSGLLIENITVSPSPDWLQQRLLSAGVNAINNIVDITNFILLELGQPMHAFDADKLSGTTIGIRAATDGEKFIALDGQTYPLSAADLVIDDNGRAVALAGVMGGLDTGVEAGCTRVFFESATFAASSVRRTAGRLDLRSESSARFEKSLDPEHTTMALRRAWQLVQEICPDARLAGEIVDDFPTPYPEITIQTSHAFLRDRLGTDEVTDAFIDRILAGLGFTLGGDLALDVPSWRRTKDVSLAEDIVEEVGRHFGYDNITPCAPQFDLQVPAENPARQFERGVKALLTEGYGCTEIMMYPMVGPKLLGRVGLDQRRRSSLPIPVSEFEQMMRPESVPQLLQAIAENAKHFPQFRLFEYGRVYDTSEMKGLLPTERTRITGTFVPAFERDSLQQETFFQGKALIQDILRLAGVDNAKTMPLTDSEAAWIHPNIHCGFYRGRMLLASLFKLHPSCADEFGVSHNAYIFEVYADRLETLTRNLKYQPISKFPTVRFEVTVVVAAQTLSGDIEAAIGRAAKRQLRSLEVLTIYEGDPIPTGKKAISYRMEFAASDRTLSHDEAESVQNKVVAALEKAGYPLKQ